MNANAKKWLEALRSGEFDQCDGVLHIKDVGYCCLGVACEVARREGLDLEVQSDDGRVTFDGSDTYLPRSVRGWLGVTTDTEDFPVVGAWDPEHALGMLNDNHGFSFEEIAEFVEANADKVFTTTKED